MKPDQCPASTPEPPPTPGTGDVWRSVIDRLSPGRGRVVLTG